MMRKKRVVIGSGFILWDDPPTEVSMKIRIGSFARSLSEKEQKILNKKRIRLIAEVL